MTPNWTRADMPVMPKGRYKIMTDYMPKVGTLGLDMMYRTCTVQANLDFSSEADMVKKLRVSLALQPVATALFANSPFTEGKPNGFLSYALGDLARHRQRARRHAAVGVRGRHGLRALCRLRARRADVFRQARRQIHRRRRQVVPRFLRRQAADLPGERATHLRLGQPLSTIFPEVRLKRYLEMRGADGGPWRRLPSLPAFWVGLLYDDAALDAAWELVKDWTAEERQKLRDDVPKLGFKAEIRDTNVSIWRSETLALARSGLTRRKRSTTTAATRRATCGRSRKSSRAASRRPKELLEKYQRAVERLGRAGLRRICVLASSRMRARRQTPGDPRAGASQRRLQAARIRLRSRTPPSACRRRKRLASSRRGCSRP